jgi:hypothetical protein
MTAAGFLSGGSSESGVLDEVRRLLGGQSSMLRAEVVSRLDGRGLHARLALGTKSGAGVVERIDARDTGRPMVAEGLEVSVFPAERLVGEILRLIPVPAGSADPASEPVRVPWEVAAAIAAEGGSATRFIYRSMVARGADNVLRPLMGQISAEAAIALTGAVSVIARRWLRGGSGWVGAAVEAGELVLVPLGRSEMRRALISDVARLIDSYLQAGA